MAPKGKALWVRRCELGRLHPDPKNGPTLGHSRVSGRSRRVMHGKPPRSRRMLRYMPSPTSELSFAGFHCVISVQHSHQHPSPAGLPEIHATPFWSRSPCMPSQERFSRLSGHYSPKTYAPFIS